MMVRHGSRQEIALAIWERLDTGGRMGQGLIDGVKEAAREYADQESGEEPGGDIQLAVLIQSSWVSGFVTALKMQEEGILGKVQPEDN